MKHLMPENIYELNIGHEESNYGTYCVRERRGGRRRKGMPPPPKKNMKLDAGNEETK